MLNANGYKYLRLSFDGFIGIIKMDRPPVNAFNLEFIDEFNNAIDEFAINSGVRVVVITSNVDKYFATGVDIKLMFTMDPKEVQSGLTNLFDKIQHLHKPVIAMINGHALGGGCELTLCCDFRFMEKDSSKIGLPEINLGIIPAAGGTQRLCRLLGRGRAIELLVLGIPLMAKEALDAGLIHKAFDHKDLMERTLEYAHKLANQAPVAVALIKKCINEGIDADLKRGLEIEREALLTALQTEDAKEGIKAFLEKRSLKFKGK